MPGASCALSGNFQSPTPGAYSLFMRLGYNEDDGSPIDVSAKGVVSNIAVVGQTVLPLPSDVVPGYQYPVIFQYTNYGNKDVTDAEVKTTQRPDFTHIAGTCPGLNGAAKGTLAAGASCLVEGTLTPQAAGSDITLSSTLTYAEQIQPSVLYTTAESSNVAVNAQAAIKLPDNMTAGHPYSFLFTFTNTSDKLSVSNLNFIKTLQHAILTSDTCAGVTSLAKGASCDIGGNYTPTIEGPAVLSVSLQYGIHNHLITAKTNGTVTKVAVTGEVLTPLPANIASNSSHTVTFQFSNTGSAPATGLTWVTVLPDFVIAPNADTCSGKATLAADESCEITGSYTATSAGTKALSVKLSYNESAQDINLLANTNVTNVVVTGALTEGIHAETKMGDGYPFKFTFTNSSSQPATNVHVVQHLPYVHDIVNTCQNSLPGNNGKCEISGNYVPIYPGYQSLSATLTYAEGNQVKVTNNVHTAGQMTYYYDFAQNYLNGSTLSSPLSGLPALNLVNSPSIAQPGPIAGQNNAINLNGNNQYGEAISPTPIGGAFTIDFWVKWNSFAQNWSRVLDFSNGPSSNNVLIGHQTTSSNFAFEVRVGSSTAINIILSNFWFTGQWVHIVINVNKNGAVRVYRNDEYINLASPPAPIGVVTNLQGTPVPTMSRSLTYIGKSAWNDGYAVSDISNFKIFEG